MVVVGVAHRLLPMFLLSYGASEWPARISLVTLSLGCLLIPLPFGSIAHLAAGIVVAIGVVAFLVQAGLFYRHRRRRTLDPGLRLASGGMLGLAVSLALAPIALRRGLADLPLLVAYVFVLLASVTVFIAGHYYKIVPFLIWYHRFGSLVGKRKVPRVAELYGERTAHVCGALMVAGAAITAVAIASGAVTLARIGAVSFALGACVEAAQMARLFTRRPT
jgi:hypothetical protein